MNVRRRALRSRRRATYLGAASLVAVCAAFLAIPGGASASSVNCSGKLFLDPGPESGPHGVRYYVKCSEEVLGVSIHVSKRIDHFVPDPVTLAPNGGPSETGKPFFCEGPIPGPGFGCPGVMTARDRVVGHFSTMPGTCYPAVRAWATVTTQQLDSKGNPFVTISHPFGLQPPDGCPSGQPAPAAFGGLGSILGLGTESGFWHQILT